ncbi:UNVERIFIED_CONTAM: UDP-glucose iridoid glucosyltransferase [Sesamum calycinum]|uniref:UDP-glucose iridoid glucosyltransferase n=1 Tax=Sesamum calycinum TaxID=2727403 RepID=A0AAW2SEH2_9LAMI
MNFVDAVAGRLKLPSIVLRTTTAAYMHSHNVMFQLLAEGFIPLPESQLEAAIPEVYPLRFKDLPLPVTIEIPQIVLDFMHSYMDIRSSSAVIWNTIDQLDHWPLQQLEQHWPVPFFSIGPFHRMAPAVATSLLEEENSCLSWLDKQAPNSVIYASLGSLAIIDENELIEMAWGLAKSEQPFLWAVRPSLLNGSDAMKSLPEEFIEITQERGMVVKWAPQKKVLAHAAVGGFLTHCGWNSTLESMCEGVPLICRPCFADQLVNARYMTHVWKVGLESEDFKQISIEKGIKTLMSLRDYQNRCQLRDETFEEKEDSDRSKEGREKKVRLHMRGPKRLREFNRSYTSFTPPISDGGCR